MISWHEELTIAKNDEHHNVDQEGGRDHLCGEPNSRQALGAAMIFGHTAQLDTPPKAAIDLDIPVLPTRIDRVVPPF